MFKPHPTFPISSPLNTKIWRYMDFTKLVSLLEKEALYFSRSDMLGDKFEGSFTKYNVERRPEIYKKYPHLIDHIPRFHKNNLKKIYINCWHINENESSAMWNLYIKSGGGIAIQSTIERLIDSLGKKDKPPTITISEVKYLNYDKDLIGERYAFDAFFTKRKSFEHERELRAIFIGGDGITEGSSPGEYINVALVKLIENIFVAPTASDWFYELVESIVKKYKFKFNIKQSDLSSDPLY